MVKRGEGRGEEQMTRGKKKMAEKEKKEEEGTNEGKRDRESRRE